MIGTTVALIMAGTAAASAASQAYAAKKANAAAVEAARIQSDAQTRSLAATSAAQARASDIEEKSNADTLAFYREQAGLSGSGGGGGGGRDPIDDARYDAQVALEAQRYKEKTALEAQRYGEAVQRRQPYMNMGLGALAQMGSAHPGNNAANPLVPQSQGEMVSAGTTPYAAQFSKTPPPVGSLSDILAKKQQTGAGA